MRRGRAGSGAERERAGGKGQGGGARITMRPRRREGDGSSERERVVQCRASPGEQIAEPEVSHVRDGEFAGRMCGSGIAMRGPREEY